MTCSFLEDVSAPKARWRDPDAEKKGIRPAYRWTGQGTYGLEMVRGTAESRPNTTTVREVWKGRHGHRAAPLLVVVSYPGRGGDRALVYGPPGDGYIHVHHLFPLSTGGGGPHEVDPIEDLRPVCPNCHAVIHRRTPSYTLEEMQKMLAGTDW